MHQHKLDARSLRKHFSRETVEKKNFDVEAASRKTKIFSELANDRSAKPKKYQLMFFMKNYSHKLMYLRNSTL